MITCFGEVLVDMLAGRIHLGDPGADDCYYPVAGGAPANVAVAVAKLGGSPKFIGGISRDRFGRFLLRELRRFGVETTHMHETNAPTALAIVSIDEHGERAFSFYGENAAHLDVPATAIPMGQLGDIRHFSSNTLTVPSMREATSVFISQGVVSFDINYRRGLWPEPAEAAAVIDDFAVRSDVIKTSLEELNELFPGSRSESTVRAWLGENASVVVITDGGNPITVQTRGNTQQFTPPAVKAVDTTAAGDAFVGGLLHAMSQAESFAVWSADVDRVVDSAKFAAGCGALAVTRPGAFPSLPTLAEVEEFHSTAGLL